MSASPSMGPAACRDMNSIPSICNRLNCETSSMNTNCKAHTTDHKGLSNFGMANVDTHKEHRESFAEDVKGECDNRDVDISSRQSVVPHKAASTVHSMKAQSITSTESHGAYPATLRLTFIVISLGLALFQVALDKTIIATAT